MVAPSLDMVLNKAESHREKTSLNSLQSQVLHVERIQAFKLSWA